MELKVRRMAGGLIAPKRHKQLPTLRKATSADAIYCAFKASDSHLFPTTSIQKLLMGMPNMSLV